jgi:membrane protein YqaA with SNARE-associated domain
MLESTVLPVALEILLLPLMQSRRKRMWQIAAAATVGCIAGAVIGYYIGVWLAAVSMPFVLDWLGDEAVFNQLKENIRTDGFWFILLAGITPVPLQLAMLAAGAVDYPLGWYILAIAVSRTLRYFGLAILTCYFGDHAEALFVRYKKPVFLILLALLVAFIGYKLFTYA